MVDKSEVEQGRLWAYRAQAKDLPARVEVLKIGQKRPPRVKIRFTDDEFEGREDWVSPSRLKVLWNGLAEWLAWERRWGSVIEASIPALDTPEAEAADEILDLLRLHDVMAAWDVVEWRASYRHAVLHVADFEIFDRETGLPLINCFQYPLLFLNGMVWLHHGRHCVMGRRHWRESTRNCFW
jgi:hypothetical protein